MYVGLRGTSRYEVKFLAVWYYIPEGSCNGAGRYKSPLERTYTAWLINIIWRPRASRQWSLLNNRNTRRI
jgi:hypothetical protein